MSQLNLSNVKRCDQVWEDMPILHTGGRQCQKCECVLTDFRQLSDAEVRRKHAESATKLCGIYSDNQLSISSPSALVKKSIKSPILLGLTTAMLTTAAQAQDATTINHHPAEQSESTSGGESMADQQHSETVATDSLSIRVSGSVLDESATPIGLATVHLIGTSIGVVTDIDGMYSLEISRDVADTMEVQVAFQFIGYGREVVSISKEDMSESTLEKNIILKEDAHLIAFEVSPIRRSWLGRRWQGVKQFFRFRR